MHQGYSQGSSYFGISQDLLRYHGNSNLQIANAVGFAIGFGARVVAEIVVRCVHACIAKCFCGQPCRRSRRVPLPAAAAQLQPHH